MLANLNREAVKTAAWRAYSKLKQKSLLKKKSIE
jgi:hypothetical protein